MPIASVHAMSAWLNGPFGLVTTRPGPTGEARDHKGAVVHLVLHDQCVPMVASENGTKCLRHSTASTLTTVGHQHH